MSQGSEQWCDVGRGAHEMHHPSQGEIMAELEPDPDKRDSSDAQPVQSLFYPWLPSALKLQLNAPPDLSKAGGRPGEHVQKMWHYFAQSCP